MNRGIEIVGGGLAGLSLGIELRSLGVETVVFEAGSYPRHKVCGEFLNGQGLDLIQRWGLLPRLVQEGATPVQDAAFFSGSKCWFHARLPSAGLSVSRFVLDQALAEEFEKRGGLLHQGKRETGPAGPGRVKAAGRQPQVSAKSWRWVGLRIQAKSVPQEADLEMHFLGAGGYVGLCRSGRGSNICGLFRSKGPLPDLRRDWRDWLLGTPGSILHQKCRQAALDLPSFKAVAGIGFSENPGPECCLGDAFRMIPPITGNGMSLALESGQIAAGLIAPFNRGEKSWEETSKRIRAAVRERTSARCVWGALAQRAILGPFGSGLMRISGSTLFEWFFHRTR